MPRLEEGSFSWAICHALELAAGNRSAGDLSVLRNDPLKFYSFVTDDFGANESFEMQALKIGCLDRGYLPIFCDAACYGAAYVEAAVSEAVAYLQRLLDENPIPPGMRANTQFRWDQSVASTVSYAMAEGIEAYMGWRCVETNVAEGEGSGATHPEVGDNDEKGTKEYKRKKRKERKKNNNAIIVTAVLIMLVLGAILGIIFIGNSGKTVYKATATLSFNANGADNGSPPKSIECDKNAEIELPTADGMSKEGYEFGGWGLTKDAHMVYREGDVYDVDNDTMLYAIWNVKVEESSEFKTTELAYAADDGGYVAMVFVTNNSKQTFDLTATFDFVDAGGKTVDSSTDAVWSIGPGDTTLVTKQTSKQSAKNVRWRMIASRPVYGESSIAPLLKAEVTRIDNNGAEVTVTNTSEKPCYLMFATLYGHDNGDHFAQQTNGVDKRNQLLEPNVSLVFIFEGNYWQFFTNDVYLYGFADKYE